MVQHKTEKFYADLGMLISKYRNEAGITQKQLASLIKVRQPVLASYEIGRRRIPIPVLLKIAEALNTYVDDLLPIEQSRKKRGPKSLIERELEKVKFLPEEQKNAILNLITTITKKNLKVS